MKDSSEKLLITVGAAASVICILFTALVILAAVWKFSPDDDTYVALNGEQHVARQLANGTIEVDRQFRINRDAEITIIRELIMYLSDGTLTRAELPSGKVIYKEGTYRTRRILEIPDGIPPGDYELHNRACWEQNPVHTTCVDLPVVKIKIRQ